MTDNIITVIYRITVYCKITQKKEYNYRSTLNKKKNNLKFLSSSSINWRSVQLQ